MNPILFGLTLFLVGAALGAQGGEMSAESNPLPGVWRVNEIRYTWEGGEQVLEEPQPGLVFFTKDHYSMTWMPRSERQADYADPWRPSDEEKVESYNSIVVNSGTYTLTDSILRTVPEVAKTPEFMGGLSDYAWRLEADTLWLDVVDIVSHAGIQDPAVPRFTTHLRLVRVE